MRDGKRAALRVLRPTKLINPLAIPRHCKLAAIQCRFIGDDRYREREKRGRAADVSCREKTQSNVTKKKY